MEEAEMVGALTWARARALASTATKPKPRRSATTAGKAAEEEEVQMRSYIRMRNRSRRRRPPENSPAVAVAEEEGTYPSSSYGSSKVTCEDEGDGSESSQTTPSSELSGEAGDLEKTDGSRSRRTSTGMMTPTESEVEEFFAAVERDERRRFAYKCSKYNYDIDNDVPLDGRFEWCPISKQ